MNQRGYERHQLLIDHGAIRLDFADDKFDLLAAAKGSPPPAADRRRTHMHARFGAEVQSKNGATLLLCQGAPAGRLRL